MLFMVFVITLFMYNKYSKWYIYHLECIYSYLVYVTQGYCPASSPHICTQGFRLRSVGSKQMNTVCVSEHHTQAAQDWLIDNDHGNVVTDQHHAQSESPTHCPEHAESVIGQCCGGCCGSRRGSCCRETVCCGGCSGHDRGSCMAGCSGHDRGSCMGEKRCCTPMCSNAALLVDKVCRVVFPSLFFSFCVAYGYVYCWALW